MLKSFNKVVTQATRRPVLQFRCFRRPATSVFFGASATLCCVLAAQTIYLDSSTSPEVDSDPFASLRRRKSTESFDFHQPVDVHAILKEHEESCFADGKTTGIARYDIVQVSSNDPNEDDHSSAIVPHSNGSWAFFAVMDGHSGWETSAWLRENLIPAVTGSLADLYHNHHSLGDSFLSKVWALIGRSSDEGGDTYTPPSKSINDNISNTFKRLDDDIVHHAVERVFASTSKNAAINLLAPAYAGSCALLAFFDSYTRMLRVAVTGDSRAVLGRRVVDPSSGEIRYEVHVLSVDQDGKNPLEIARLNNSPEHPGETVIQNGRVLGMGPSRAFGDARWKWDEETQARLKKDYLGRTKPKNVKTPPYLTAEPEITTTKVERGDFLIMATDGLWECLQSEEAVGLVGAWLEAQHSGNKDGEVVQRESLPVQFPNTDETVRYSQWFAKKAFVNMDSNAATHLTRNALGGGDADLASALLSMRNPRARTYRDDITAVVVFFE